MDLVLISHESLRVAFPAACGVECSRQRADVSLTAARERLTVSSRNTPPLGAGILYFREECFSRRPCEPSPSTQTPPPPTQDWSGRTRLGCHPEQRTDRSAFRPNSAPCRCSRI